MRNKFLMLVPLFLMSNFIWAANDVLDKSPSHFALLKAEPNLKIHYKLLPADQNRSKATLVFVHGWCCDLSVWERQAAAFNGKINMLFVDLPGFGQSDHPRIDYTMDLFAKA